MPLIVCSDIFGVTDSLKELVTRFLPDAQCIFISPFDDPDKTFSDESKAYEQFQASGSVQTYADRLASLVKNINKPVTVIGFSAGASAMWLAQALNKHQIERCLAFYPGQIRHYLSTRCEVTFDIVFPLTEKHFDVGAVIEHLSAHKNLSVHQCQFKHGFMNALSDNFDEVGYQSYGKYMAAWLEDKP